MKRHSAPMEKCAYSDVAVFYLDMVEEELASGADGLPPCG